MGIGLVAYEDEHCRFWGWCLGSMGMGIVVVGVWVCRGIGIVGVWGCVGMGGCAWLGEYDKVYCRGCVGIWDGALCV